MAKKVSSKKVLQRHQQFHEGREKTPVFWRENLPAYFEHEGAVIIEGKDFTVVVTPDMSFSVDGYGDIVIFK